MTSPRNNVMSDLMTIATVKMAFPLARHATDTGTHTPDLAKTLEKF